MAVREDRIAEAEAAEAEATDAEETDAAEAELMEARTELANVVSAYHVSAPGNGKNGRMRMILTDSSEGRLRNVSVLDVLVVAGDEKVERKRLVLAIPITPSRAPPRVVNLEVYLPSSAGRVGDIRLVGDRIICIGLEEVNVDQICLSPLREPAVP